MRVIPSQLLVLILMHLTPTTAAPLPPPHKACIDYLSCSSARKIISPPSTPHFAAHHPSPPPNAPLTPPPTLSPSAALSAQRPLSSSYLQLLSSLNNAGSPSSSADALPSKPTSALAELRKEDAVRYWAEEAQAAASLVKPAEQKGGKGAAVGVECQNPRLGHASGREILRDYNDVMVVGLVILFLAAVVVFELMGRVGDLETSQPKGEIYLEDDDQNIAYLVKDFRLQPAPPRKYSKSLVVVKVHDVDREEKDMEWGRDEKV